MEITTDIKRANELLELYNGSTLQILKYTPSLKRLALKLTIVGNSEVVFLVGIGCHFFNGEFYYNDANITIIQEINTEEDRANRTKIFDTKRSFELITFGGFSLAKGNESEFGTIFEDFILEH